MALALLGLRFADGTEHYVDARDAAAVLRGYTVPAPFVRARCIFDMVAAYAEKHAAAAAAAAEPDVAGWDRRLMDRVRDTDTLHDLFLASSELGVYGLMDLCARMTADVVRGGIVEEIKSLLGIADVGLTPEQDRQAQLDHERRLRIR